MLVFSYFPIVSTMILRYLYLPRPIGVIHGDDICLDVTVPQIRNKMGFPKDLIIDVIFSDKWR